MLLYIESIHGQFPIQTATLSFHRQSNFCMHSAEDNHSYQLTLQSKWKLCAVISGTSGEIDVEF